MEDLQSFVGLQPNNPTSNESGNFSMSDLMEQSFDFRTFHHGDVVEGVVVHVSASEVLIDIGSKSEGVVSGRELERMGAEARTQLQVGEQVLAYVINPEDKSGNVVLSLSHAQMERDWREAERRFQAGEIFTSVVSGYNKGGLITHIGKVRGFVPASQLTGTSRAVESEEKRAEELARFVGQEMPLKIIEVDRKRNRLILSQRAAMRESRQEQKEKLLTDLVEGTTVRGKVSNLCDFGAFVNLGGADGLIHISELSWGRVTHPREVLKVGEEIEVFVLNVDQDRQRIGLSLKRLQPEPWSQVENRYTVDQVVDGRVTKLASFGAFVRIDDEIEGLIHVSELAERHVSHPKEVLEEGDQVTVRIIRIDPDRKRIGLSIKGMEEQADIDWQVDEEEEPVEMSFTSEDPDVPAGMDEPEGVDEPAAVLEESQVPEGE